MVQLAKRRGAEVIAISSTSKHEMVRGFGADRVLGREENPVKPVFPHFVGYIANAQRAFQAKRHAGKIVLVPPS